MANHRGLAMSASQWTGRTVTPELLIWREVRLQRITLNLTRRHQILNTPSQISSCEHVWCILPTCGSTWCSMCSRQGYRGYSFLGAGRRGRQQHSRPCNRRIGTAQYSLESLEDPGYKESINKACLWASACVAIVTHNRDSWSVNILEQIVESELNNYWVHRPWCACL